MAERTLTVRLLGNERDLLRAFQRSSRGARGFQRDMSATVRGTLAGSGAFRTLSRSLALASGGFLTAAAAAGAIRGAFSELNESRRVTAQTNAVLESTGRIAGVTAQHVENLGNQLLRKTGIDDEAIRSTENLLLTFTNLRNVAGEGNNIFDQATVAVLDMSTAMGGDLQGAAVRVGKALQDPIRGVTALRRVGVQLTKSQEAQIKSFVETGRTLDAQRIILRELTREFGGSAEAAGRVQPWNLLRETLRNISAEIVSGMLPNIIDLTDRFQRWLDNTQNVERVKQAFRDAGDAIRTIAGFIQGFVDALGGLRTTLTILIGAWAGFKVAGIVSAVAVQSAHIKAAGVTASAWRAALISTGWGAFAVAAGVAAAYVITHWEKVKTFFERLWLTLKAGAVKAALAIVEPFTHIPTRLGERWREAHASLLRQMDALREDYRQAGRRSGEAFAQGMGEVFTIEGGPGMTLRIPGTGTAFPPGLGGAGAPKGVTATQRNAWFDALIDRKRDLVQDERTLQAQVAALGRIAGLIRERLGITKDITRRLTLEAELRDIGRQQKGLRDQIATNKIEARRLALELEQERLAKERERVAKALERTKARQFRALGLGPTGGEIIPGVRALRRQLGSITDAVRGTFLDTGKTRSLLSQIRKILSGGLGAVNEEVRSKIRELLADIDQQLKEQTGTLTKRRKASANALLSGLGLDSDEIRALRARLSRVGVGGTVSAGGVGAFGMVLPAGAGSEVVVHNNVYLDGDLVERTTTRRQQKRQRRNPPQKRGPNAGR